MGAKKVKKIQEPPKDRKKSPMMNNVESESEELSLTSASFIKGLQQDFGAPLHSTAIEEDMKAAEEKQNDKGQGKVGKKREEAEKGKEPKMKATPQKSKKRVVAVKGKKAVKRKSAGDTAAARPVKRPKFQSKTKSPESESGKSSGPQPQEESDGGPSQTSRNMSSDEDVEDTSWKPSPKKKVHGSGKKKSRKSSSGSGSQPENVRKKKSQKSSFRTELEVVLEAFKDFCGQYKETVESEGVKKALDYFSSNVKEQLMEKISITKQLKALTRENSKMASSIRTTRQRLLDAKNAQMKSERELRLLQKEKSKLELKLDDLSQGRTFLQNITKLNKQYLQYKQTHPKEKETYEASSLPALLLEAKHVQTTERQLRAINDRLEKTLKNQAK